MGDRDSKMNTKSTSNAVAGASIVKKNDKEKEKASTDCGDSLSLHKIECSLLVKINTLLDKKLKDFRVCILSDFNQHFDSLNNQMGDLQLRVEEIEMNLSTVHDNNLDAEREKRTTDVVITGIPATENEIPIDIYKNIAAAVNIYVSPFSTAFRAKHKKNDGNGSNSTSSKKTSNMPIIVRLSCTAERNILFSALRKRNQPLLLNEINCGFVSTHKIGIFESLLPRDNAIKLKTNSLRKNGKLHAVRTFKCVVDVQVCKDDSFIKINTTEQLNNLFKN